MIGFFRLDRDLARRLATDGTLTVKEYRVVLALAAATRNPGDTVDASNAFLAAETGLSRKAVQLSRKALVSKGYIISDHDGNGSSHRALLAGGGEQAVAMGGVRAVAGSGVRPAASARRLHITKETKETTANRFSGSAGGGDEMDWDSYRPDPVFVEMIRNLTAKQKAEGENNG